LFLQAFRSLHLDCEHICRGVILTTGIVGDTAETRSSDGVPEVQENVTIGNVNDELEEAPGGYTGQITVCTGVNIETKVYITLKKPFSELTQEEIDNLQNDCIENYNDLSLSDCGPNSTLLVRCTFQEYTVETSSGRRFLNDEGLSFNTALIFGEGTTSSSENNFF
jgi:hypothetical protein